MNADRKNHEPSLQDDSWIQNLSRTERDVVLAFLVYRMPMDLRRKLALYHPALYNKIAGKAIYGVGSIRRQRLVVRKMKDLMLEGEQDICDELVAEANLLEEELDAS